MRKRHRTEHAAVDRDAMWDTAPPVRAREGAAVEAPARPEPATYEDSWYRVLGGPSVDAEPDAEPERASAPATPEAAIGT